MGSVAPRRPRSPRSREPRDIPWSRCSRSACISKRLAPDAIARQSILTYPRTRLHMRLAQRLPDIALRWWGILPTKLRHTRSDVVTCRVQQFCQQVFIDFAVLRVYLQI